MTIPRPGCSCRVCVEARTQGAPVRPVRAERLRARPRRVDRHAGGVEAPAQPVAGRPDRGRALLALASRPHGRAASLGVAQLRLPLLAAPVRDDAPVHPRARLGGLRGELRARRTVPVPREAGDGRGEAARRGRDRSALGEFTITPVPLEAENAFAFLFEGEGQAGSDRDGRDARLDAADARAARPRRASDRRLRAPSVYAASA